jgi:hypothetical protein
MAGLYWVAWALIESWQVESEVVIVALVTNFHVRLHSLYGRLPGFLVPPMLELYGNRCIDIVSIPLGSLLPSNTLVC